MQYSLDGYKIEIALEMGRMHRPNGLAEIPIMIILLRMLYTFFYEGDESFCDLLSQKPS
jgi:hypothetical protein